MTYPPPHPGAPHPDQQQPHPGQPYPQPPYPGVPYPASPYPDQLNAAQLNAAQLNAAQLNAAQLNAAQLNAAQPNAAQPNGAQPYSAGQPYANQAYANQAYANQPYPGQPYPHQPFANQPYPNQPPYPGLPYPGPSYPGLPYGYPIQLLAPRDPTGAVGARVGQYVVDALLVAVPVIVLLVGFGSLSADADPGSSALPLVVTLLLFLLGAAGGWLVFAWWPSTHAGQTPAMGWLNLRIVTEYGGPPSLGALTVRWLLLAVDGQACGLVGLIVMLTTARHQRVGDMAASTLVVRTD